MVVGLFIVDSYSKLKISDENMTNIIFDNSFKDIEKKTIEEEV